jgi:hypothetical protein
LYNFAWERLHDRVFLNRFALDGAVIERMLIQHKKGKGERGFMLWKLLQLALFADLHAKNNLIHDE